LLGAVKACGASGSSVQNSAVWMTCRRGLSAFSLQFDSFGDPLDIVEMRKIDLPDSPPSGCALVKMMASTINPSDINTLQGVYPIKPDGFPPGTGGNEGVGEVMAVGNEVKDLQVGDWVIPANAGLWGTWSTHVMQPSEKLLKIPNDIPLLSAATLAVNPCTAYRMLKDFVTLSDGDSFVQNGSNSAVGQAAIQIGQGLGLKSINVVRHRETGMEELKTFLTGLGADLVITESDLRDPKLKDVLSSCGINPPRLGLDCVGGKTATDMMRILQNGSTTVTYGGMSKQPMKVPASALIFKDIRVRGFWMSAWNKAHRKQSSSSQTSSSSSSSTSSSADPSREMIDFLCSMIRDGKLSTPKLRQVPFTEFRDALKMSTTPMITEKQVLVF